MVHPSEKLTADEKLKIICLTQSKETKSDCSLNKSSVVVHSCRKSADNLLLTKLKNKVVIKKSLEVEAGEVEKSGSEICKSLYGINTRRRNRTRTKVNSATVRSHDESANLMGKFVLPSRSMHSSRVIKPNKKFINNDLRNSNADNNVYYRRTQTCDERLGKNEKKDRKCANVKACAEVCNTVNTGLTKNESTKLDLSTQVTVKADNTEVNRLGGSWQCGGSSKLVLRKARLQLHSQNGHESRTGDGPFSSHAPYPSAGSSGPPGTVTCGVCGAVRFYRFVKQARKFNIYSCESCRKFISKMIKRQSCSKSISVPSLVCHKGQGKLFHACKLLLYSK